MLLDTLKHTAAVVSLAAVVTTFTAGFAPAVTEAAPPPRGGVRVVHHQPGLRPVVRQPRPAIHGPSVHHHGPKPGRGPVIHQSGSRPGHVPGRWQPGHRPGYGSHGWRPAPFPLPRYDRHDARRDRRIACGAAAVAVLAALFGGR